MSLLQTPLLRGLAGLLLGAALLAGCASQKLFDEGRAQLRSGQVDAGLAKLEEAVRLEPGNAEYRIALAVERASALQRLFNQAEAARRDGRRADAERGYREVLRLEPQHAMAQQALAAMAQEDRHQALVAQAEAAWREGGAAQAGAALERLRSVLAADPRHKAALKLKEQIDDARTREQAGPTALAESFRRPITLQFNDAPLRQIFDAISRISGLNFYFDKDVRADARGTILARSTTVEDAVRLLLLTNQLDQKVLDDSSVLVYPNTAQKQKDYQTLVVRSFFLANADVKAVSNAIKAIVKTKDLVVDERLGTILMRDTADAVRVAERIVALQDLGDPEVMLEVEVLEIKRSKLQELGLQWPGQLTLSPLPGSGDATTLNDVLNLRSTTVRANLSSAIVNLNQQDQNANILTNPRIRVRNKEKAKVLIGDRIPVITTTTSGTASFLSESVTYVDVGLKLEVEPTVYLDDEVAIKMSLEVSSLVREVLSKNGTLTYQIGTRGANTVLRLKDGETQVLAGLISDEARAAGNRIPGLGQLPMLGRLFGSQKDDDQRSELLLSITPRVLRSLTRPALAAAEFESGTESAVGVAAPRLRRAEGLAAPAAGPTAGGAAPLAAPAIATRPMAPTASTAPPPASTARPGAASAGFASLAPVAAARLYWQGPAQVQAGQEFSVIVRGSGVGHWQRVMLDLGYDAQALQLLDVRAGALFSPPDGNGSLLRQPDAGDGRLRVTLALPPAAEGAPPPRPVAGVASDVLILQFKALRAAQAALSISAADALPATPELALPPPHGLRLLP
ncbi:Putative secretion system X protein GspD-like [Rubrivivax sp. A210]|uniref:general secretion pathway protein GspD n=1 Tax=Rubrivivax sp. A210 TaxID=2772301 RepID=UPI00191ADA3F|nr:general secretion pathway protein GspD [Rubrivivax sp. A210]CAD5372845.1 Putative secretion system X protein GspD-like [Rubrivivax sp. A210]